MRPISTIPNDQNRHFAQVAAGLGVDQGRNPKTIGERPLWVLSRVEPNASRELGEEKVLRFVRCWPCTVLVGARNKPHCADRFPNPPVELPLLQGRLLWDRRNEILFFLYMILTTKSTLWAYRKTLSDPFFSEGSLLEEQLVRKFVKNRVTKHQKSLDQKSPSQEIRRRPSDERSLQGQTYLETQTSREKETDVDDCVATVAAYVRRGQRIKNIAEWAFFQGFLDEEDAIMSQDNRRTYTKPLQRAVQLPPRYRCCWRPLAQSCLHGTVRPASCICVVEQAPHDRRPRAQPCQRHRCRCTR